MTAQRPDTIQFNKETYSITGIIGSGLFEPTKFNLMPVSKLTSCWRGYVCHYKVYEGRIYLDSLEVNLDADPPELFDIEPTKLKKGSAFDAIYENLRHEIGFTGRILAGRDFISDLYVHMGFHPAWKFKKVHEFSFHNGILDSELDRSVEAEKYRKNPETGQRTIEDSFRMDFDILNQTGT